MTRREFLNLSMVVAGGAVGTLVVDLHEQRIITERLIHTLVDFSQKLAPAKPSTPIKNPIPNTEPIPSLPKKVPTPSTFTV